MKAPRALLPGAVLLLLLAGCGADRSDDAGEDGGVSEPTASGPAEDPSRAPTPPGSQIRVEGTVVEGVEAGCLLLVAAGREYLLLGAQPEVGARVEVVGTVERGAMSTCQQGVPLRVERLTTAGS